MSAAVMTPTENTCSALRSVVRFILLLLLFGVSFDCESFAQVIADGLAVSAMPLSMTTATTRCVVAARDSRHNLSREPTACRVVRVRNFGQQRDRHLMAVWYRREASP